MTILPTGFFEPRKSVRLEDCEFYHHIAYPNGEEHTGHWDLRGCVEDYLGRLDYSGSKVIEIGPASGYLTFAMEARGANVTAVELSNDYVGDIVPLPGRDPTREEYNRKQLVDRVIKSFWYGHERMNSRATVYYGNARCLPDDIGIFDIGLLGAVMLHSRDPFGMLIACANRVKQRIVIVDAWHEWMERNEPFLRFVPERANRNNNHTWWQISPSSLAQLLGILEFEVETIYRFVGLRSGTHPYPLYSLVARRTA
jgi:O-methyltransferase